MLSNCTVAESLRMSGTGHSADFEPPTDLSVPYRRTGQRRCRTVQQTPRLEERDRESCCNSVGRRYFLHDLAANLCSMVDAQGLLVG